MKRQGRHVQECSSSDSVGGNILDADRKYADLHVL